MRQTSAVVCVFLLFWGLSVPAFGQNEGAEAKAPAKGLKVALFPYLPNRELIETKLKEAWDAANPSTPVEFVYWDCYEEDPPAGLDVFEFDVMYLERLVRQNRLSPLELENLPDPGDFFPFALRGSMVDGRLYAVPRLTCTPVLFQRKADQALAGARSLDELEVVVGQTSALDRLVAGKKAAQGEGLLISLAGGTTCSGYLLDAISDQSGSYSVQPALPAAGKLPAVPLWAVRRLTQMAGREQALFRNWDGQRARWFAAGYGRAFVGYTERLAFMPVQFHKEVSVRALPLAARNRTNLLYVDAVGIDPLLSGERRKAALEFVEFVTSAKAALAALLVKNPRTGSPQYLLPARRSVLKSSQLQAEAPLYGELRDLVSDEAKPRAFRIGPEVREWLAGNASGIREAVTSE